MDFSGRVLRNISLDDIFDFVSPREFEAFEHLCFKAEAAAAKEKHDAKEAAALAKRKRGRPRKAVHSATSSSGSEEDSSVKSASSDEAAEPISAPVATDRRGRPRPKYTQFYPKQRSRHEEVKQRESLGSETGKQPAGK